MKNAKGKTKIYFSNENNLDCRVGLVVPLAGRGAKKIWQQGESGVGRWPGRNER